MMAENFCNNREVPFSVPYYIQRIGSGGAGGGSTFNRYAAISSPGSALGAVPTLLINPGASISLNL
jgi:hypothetical protein